MISSEDKKNNFDRAFKFYDIVVELLDQEPFVSDHARQLTVVALNNSSHISLEHGDVLKMQQQIEMLGTMIPNLFLLDNGCDIIDEDVLTQFNLSSLLMVQSLVAECAYISVYNFFFIVNDKDFFA